tara:strand:- start:758 stop:1267 length:510 start_codon:yes stop_codon:yes gene_type:complete
LKELFKIGFIFIFTISIFIGVKIFQKNKNSEDIRELSYDSNEEIKPYIDKFFRDLNNHGLTPVIPQDFIVKFSDLESHKNTSHTHGISFGYKDDDRVEIYINKNSWNSFNKTQKYYIVYHELSHDILNLDDLNDSDENYGDIMYPYISKYDGLKMNDFIHNMKLLFDSL